MKNTIYIYNNSFGHDYVIRLYYITKYNIVHNYCIYPKENAVEVIKFNKESSDDFINDIDFRISKKYISAIKTNVRSIKDARVFLKDYESNLKVFQ